MKNRTLFYYLLALIILSVLTYFVLRKSFKKSTLKTEETSFSVKDTASVYKIFYADKKGKKILLERKEINQWVVNEKQLAQKDLIDMTLQTLHNLSIKSPSVKAARDNAIRELATKGIKVEIYEKDKEPKIFFVGETTPDELSTYMLMEGSENPYLVHLPGWDINLRFRFFMDEWEWRSRLLFHVKPENLKNLTVRYPRKDSGNFTITKVGNIFKLEGENNSNEEKIKNYLSMYGSIYMESFIKTKEKPLLKDSLLQNLPDCSIQLTDDTEITTEIDIYLISGNPDRMYGLAGKEKEPVTVQHYVFDALIVGKHVFF